MAAWGAYPQHNAYGGMPHVGYAPVAPAAAPVWGGGGHWNGAAAPAAPPPPQSNGWGGGNSWSGGGGSGNNSGKGDSGGGWSSSGGGGGGGSKRGGGWPDDRPKGSCFTCGSTDHQQDDCPKHKAFFEKKKERPWQQGDDDPDVDVEARPHAQPFLPATQFQTPDERASVMAHRETVLIVVKSELPDVAVAPVLSFAEVDGILPAYVTEALAKQGISKPMPIQQQAMPFLLQGFDLIGIAKTGSGKTLAFLLPAIAHVERQGAMPYGEASPTALILAPVRELAVQIAEEANKLLWHSKTEKHPNGCGCVALYGGGMPIRFRQIDELKKGYCQIVAGTPGRVVDLTICGDLKLDRVIYFVLDEADRMLDSGFGDQMDGIAAHVSAARQTVFFSATWPLEVRKVAKRMCTAPPIRVNVGQAEEAQGEQCGPSARNDITQEIVVFDSEDWKAVDAAKQSRMVSHVRELLKNPEFKILVFVSAKQATWELAEQMQKEGFKADFMYGGRSQDARHEVVRQLKTGEIRLLVSTDVMARGLDIPNISHVVVYDCMGGVEEYVHRIGRTARGPYGKGNALAFFQYDPKFSEMAGDLIKLLEEANQVVPPELQKIADEVLSGARMVKYQKKW